MLARSHAGSLLGTSVPKQAQVGALRLTGVGAIEKSSLASVRIATVTFIKLVIFVYYHYVEPTGIKKTEGKD